MAFKINYTIRPEAEEGLNEPGTLLVSLVSGSTRTKGSIYQVIKNPKTGKKDESFIHYISDKGHPVKAGKTKWRTFKKATEEQIKLITHED